MGRIKLTSQLTRAVVSRAAVQMDLRPRIPALQYLQVLHHAAMTGQMPIFRRNEQGAFEVTSESQPIDANDRLSIMHSLLKKVLPDMRDTDDQGITEAMANEAQATDVAAERLSALSVDDLRAIAARAQIPAPPTTPNSPCRGTKKPGKEAKAKPEEVL